MDIDVNTLKSNLEQYTEQLSQVSTALAAAPEDEELQQLAASLRELIELTAQQCAEFTRPEPSSPAVSNNGPVSNGLDNEMERFKAELAVLEGRDPSPDRLSSSSDSESDSEPSGPPSNQPAADLKSTLQMLVGTRCRAPFTHDWGQLEYHAAVVEGVHEACLQHAVSPADVKLRVLFSHPTQRTMQPCRYYLRRTCDYGDDGQQCRFSHGHLVSVADIREYSESEDLAVGASVLVPREGDSGLWQRATVQAVDAAAEEATVAVTGHRQQRTLPLTQLVPLPDAQSPGDVSSDSESDEQAGSPSPGDPDPEETEFCPRLTWDAITSTEKLGAWEKHTKGVGSRLMRQMGYVVGSGLGPQAEGRVLPVEACVYPVGRSLDHCMALRDGSAAVGGAPLLSVEKHLERQQKRQEKLDHRAYHRSRRQNAMFDVINRVMATGPEVPDPSSRPSSSSVKTVSRSELNVRNLQVGEQIRAVERQVARLEAGCRRNPSGAAAAELRSRLEQEQAQLDGLKAAERRIQAEQRLRADTKRLDVF